jgi:hypothetical protein
MANFAYLGLFVSLIQNDPERAYQVIRRMLRVFAVAGVDRQVIENACDLAWRDFEDAVQAAAGHAVDCHYLVTRNVQDYAGSPLTAIQPADFLAVWASSTVE